MTVGRRFTEAERRRVVLPCKLELVKTWIAIQLLDENDQPVPNEDYIIVLPDGTEIHDKLDASGYAYFGDLDPGQCSVAFPGTGEFLDHHNELMASRHTDPASFGPKGPVAVPIALPGVRTPPVPITVELQDADGAPMDGQPFEIALPNGDVARGFLDGVGKARVDGIEPAGDCRIRFTDVDAAFLSFVNTV